MDRIENDNRFKNTVSCLAEHFEDYLVIAKDKGGLIWRMSDRTFAAGAIHRLGIRLSTEDQLALRPPPLDDDGDRERRP